MKPKYNEIATADATPEASSTIETFRAIGYTLETALADIIDNSITAGARNIWITRIWNGCDSSICIKDDGCGMDREEAINAMRPGSKNPLSDRDEEDLGRFGLGLKTASFSQCRVLTLLSRKEGCEKTHWTWDLNFVGQCHEWKLLDWMPEENSAILDDVKTGTAVIWSELDRIIPEDAEVSDEEARRKFTEQLANVRKHLAMTFHRFIEDGDIHIWWGDSEIEPWDPFCKNEPKTQEHPMDVVQFKDRIVDLKGYILPHKDDFSSEEAYLNAEGINGYNAQQGFYVYRGKRLLLAGDWLGLFRKEEHYKLVRIQIDLPNTLDREWQIDIKKSTAVPPSSCREFLRSYARSVRLLGVEVYRHRGRIIRHRSGKKFQTMWNEKKTGNTVSFVINRQHAFVQYLKLYAEEKPAKAIEMLMSFIEESIPTKSIYIKEAEAGETSTPELSEAMIKNLKEVAAGIYKAQRMNGTPEDVVKEEMKQQAPFNDYEFIIDELHD